MAYLVSTLWPWVVAAIVLGVVVGAATGRPPRQGETARAGLAADLLAWALAAVLAAGMAAAALQWFRGRHGLWLDMALAMTVAYLLGCGIGALLRRLGAPAASGVEQPPAAVAVTVLSADVEVPTPPAGPADVPLPVMAEAGPSRAEPSDQMPGPVGPARPKAKKPRVAKPPVGEPPEPAPKKASRPRRATQPLAVPPEARSRKPRGKPKA